MQKKTLYKESVPGPFQVDTDCIACDTCVTLASHHFALTADNDHAYVRLQPKNESEWTQCRDALSACPVGAIHQEMPH